MTSLSSRVGEALAAKGMREALGRADALAAYLELLLGANAGVNLVSRREAVPEILVERHLVDALEALPLFPSRGVKQLRLLDVGSGGGLPAIPLLIVRGDVDGVLVESVGKKARFLEEAVRSLGLTARVLNARFPDPAIGQMKNSGRCDLLTTRAVAGAGEIVRAARPVLERGACALVWTSEPLLGEVRRVLPGAVVDFRKSPGADRRGIARVEGFT